MVESHVVGITPAQHADQHRHGGGDALTGDVRIDMPEPNTSAVVTGSRALNTNYQNAGTNPIYVAVDTQMTTGGSKSAFVKATSPADVRILRNSNGINGAIINLFFVVPPGFYYRVAVDAGVGVLQEWTEFS